MQTHTDAHRDRHGDDGAAVAAVAAGGLALALLAIAITLEEVVIAVQQFVPFLH
jgi:hypothetical protein